MKQSRKEFIKRAHESACSNWKIEIEKEFPKLFVRDELEVGKWYKSNMGRILCCTKNTGHTFDGYGVDKYGNWINEESFWSTSDFSPATDKEVEEALIKEAKKRGFKEGVSIDSLCDGGCNNVKIIEEGISLDNMDAVTELRCGYGYTIFNDGKWATIIDQPKKLTVEEVEKELGYKVEIIS